MANILGDLPSTTDLDNIAGAGGINYLQIGNITKDFEANLTTGWNRYANTTPAALPEVSPGGSPNVAFTLTSTASSPLRGTYSGLITKDANNRQGHGIRTDAFSIHNVDISQPLFISFDYEMSSNYVAGDMKVYVSDGTNILYPSLVDIPGGKGTLKVAFNATTSTSYRLIFHVASTSALSYTMKYDTCFVGPEQQLVTAAVSDWNFFTPVLTASGGGTVDVGTSGFANKNAYWRRVGDSMELNVGWRWGTTSPQFGTSGEYRFALPSGYALDTSKLPARVPPNNNRCVIGHGYYDDDSSSTHYSFEVTYFNGNIEFWMTTGTTAILGPTSPVTVQANDSIEFSMLVPIIGWSSNINLAASSTEYAYNTSAITAAGAIDTSSFGYGSEGTYINAVNSTQTIPSQTTFRVRFKTPIQPTDILVVELLEDTRPPWVPVTAHGFETRILNTTFYGITLGGITGGEPTDIDVHFGNGGARAYNSGTYGAANGDPWSGYTTWKWRVRKSSAAAVIGTSLPDYETYQQDFTFSGPFSAPVTTTWEFVRIGKHVTCHIPRTAATAAGVGVSTATSSDLIPTRFIPEGPTTPVGGDNTQNFWVRMGHVFSGSSTTLESLGLAIGNDGSVRIYNKVNWATVANNGWASTTVCWKIP